MTIHVIKKLYVKSCITDKLENVKVIEISNIESFSLDNLCIYSCWTCEFIIVIVLHLNTINSWAIINMLNSCFRLLKFFLIYSSIFVWKFTIFFTLNCLWFNFFFFFSSSDFDFLVLIKTMIFHFKWNCVWYNIIYVLNLNSFTKRFCSRILPF